MSSHSKHPHQEEDHLDLVPLIDCVFLLLLFFILCGRISFDQRTEMITVPPTKTARILEKGTDAEWERIIINVHGKTQTSSVGTIPKNTITVGKDNFISTGPNDFTSYQRLRQFLDQAYTLAPKIPGNEKIPGLMVPKRILEIRADADTEFRVVQEVQQIATDTIDPFNKMMTKQVTPKDMKPFIYIDFTTRLPSTK